MELIIYNILLIIVENLENIGFHLGLYCKHSILNKNKCLKVLKFSCLKIDSNGNQILIKQIHMLQSCFTRIVGRI